MNFAPADAHVARNRPILEGMETAETTALTPRRNRAQEALLIAKRRELVAHFRFIEELTESEIVDELAKVGIAASRSTVARDIEAMRGKFRRVFRQGAFDSRSEVGILIGQLRFAIASSFRDAKSATDGRERALHRQTAVGSIDKLMTLLMNVGLVAERDFVLPHDDGKQAERLPSAAEIAKWLDGVRVDRNELISEAEREYMGAVAYGDGALAERLRRVNGSGNGHEPPDEERR